MHISPDALRLKAPDYSESTVTNAFVQYYFYVVTIVHSRTNLLVTVISEYCGVVSLRSPGEMFIFKQNSTVHPAGSKAEVRLQLVTANDY